MIGGPLAHEKLREIKPGDNAAILTLSRVSKVFTVGEQQIRVLDDVNLSISRSTSVALIGPSGSGKSTLVGVCAGLEVPTSGDVYLLGQNMSALSERDRTLLRRNSVGLVFQNFQLVTSLTALENVIVPLDLLKQKNSRRRASDILGLLGLSERLRHYPAQLSGGEQQRVAIARALVFGPQILFCDEPTGSLDAATAIDVRQMLLTAAQEKGATLVIATHDLELAQLCQVVVRLRNGRVVPPSPENQSQSLVTQA